MIFQCHGRKKQLLTAFSVYLGQMVGGYTIGWMAPVVPKLQDPATSPLPNQITDFQISLVGSLLYLGALPGPYLIGYLANIRGRRPCMVLGGVCYIISYMILATAKTLLMIYIARFLSGFGGGITGVMALVYLGEIASTNIRGILLTGIGIFMTGGSIVALCVGPFVSYAMSAYVGVILASIYTIAIFWIPESPTYYALKGNKDSVAKVLDDLGRIDDIDKVLTPTKEEDSWKDWKELFTLRGNRRALVITVTLNVFQHGSGMIAVTSYATSIFDLAGSNIKPALATIILGFTQLFGGIITPIFVERIGRRKLLVSSTAICCLSMLILGVYFYLKLIDHWALDSLRWMPITTLITFYVGYDSGLGIIPNVISGEMFEPNVRSKGCAFAVIVSYITGFIITTAFGSLITVVGGNVMFWFFSAVCALAFLYTIFFVPETTGKSLKEIQEMLSK